MISCKVDELEPRAEQVAADIAEAAGEGVMVETGRAESQVGGGSLPTAGLATPVVRLASTRHSPDEITARLRRGKIPIIARIADDKVIIDLRTVRPGEDEALAQQIIVALVGSG